MGSESKRIHHAVSRLRFGGMAKSLPSMRNAIISWANNAGDYTVLRELCQELLPLYVQSILALFTHGRTIEIFDGAANQAVKETRAFAESSAPLRNQLIVNW